MTGSTLTLATWNVMKPVSDLRRQAIRSHMEVQSADLWVLTESHDGFMPGLKFHHSSEAGRDGNHLPQHRWVSVWSNSPLQPLETSDPQRACAARVSPEGEAPYTVYGTVLPWKESAWREHTGRGGAAFREAVAAQSADWARLQKQFPEDEFFVLGDFNQDMVDPAYCGLRSNLAALTLALDQAGLFAMTAGAADPVRRDSGPLASIDHICGRRDSNWLVKQTVRWPNDGLPQRALSDHFGVAVKLVRRG